MKKATRLLILTAFVFPLFVVTRAYAGGPGPGQRINYGERERLGLDPFGVHTTDPSGLNARSLDNFRSTESDYNPLHLQDPIGNPVPEMDRNDLYQRALGHDGHPVYDAGGNGGGTAPLDGGISLLLAAGIGLGIKRARARKQTV
jgi:hypothetical protein